MPRQRLSREDVHIDVPLSNYVQRDYAPQGYVNPMIAPFLFVQKESDKYWTVNYDRRNYDTLRAPGTEAGDVEIGMSSGEYFCEEYAARSVWPDRIKANADSAPEIEKRKVEQAKDTVMIGRELRVAALAQAVGNTTAAIGPWDGSGADPDPQKDIDDAIYTIMGRIGVRPNRVKIPFKAVQALDQWMKAAAHINDPRSLITRIFQGEDLWGLKPVVTFNQYDTSTPGQSQSLSQIWTETELIVYYSEERPSLDAQGFMQTFCVRRNGDVVKDGLPERVRRWYKPETETEYFEYSILCQSKVTNSNAAQRITGVVA